MTISRLTTLQFLRGTIDAHDAWQAGFLSPRSITTRPTASDISDSSMFLAAPSLRGRSRRRGHALILNSGDSRVNINIDLLGLLLRRRMLNARGATPWSWGWFR